MWLFMINLSETFQPHIVDTDSSNCYYNIFQTEVASGVLNNIVTLKNINIRHNCGNNWQTAFYMYTNRYMCEYLLRKNHAFMWSCPLKSAIRVILKSKSCVHSKWEGGRV